MSNCNIQETSRRTEKDSILFSTDKESKGI